MTSPERFVVIEIRSFRWPADLILPAKHFRLFVAADATNTPRERISRLAEEALIRGMVYCCAWGPGCERVQDIVDDVLAASEIAKRPIFTPATRHDTVMTTWHDDETLEDALEFFVWSSCPTESYEKDSNVWLAFSVAKLEWTAIIRDQLRKQRKSPAEQA